MTTGPDVPAGETVLSGRQTPRIENVPAYVTSGGSDAVELAALAGLVLDPWQQRVLTGALGRDAEGHLTASEVGLIVGRQNGKTVIVQAASLDGLYLRKVNVVYTAHLLTTASKLRERMQQLIESVPDLDREIRQIRISNNEQSIRLKSGARMDFVARNSNTARGWSEYALTFLDEAFAVTSSHIGAIMPIMFAVRDWQIWYVSMAGMETSDILRTVRRRGLVGDPGLAYTEWSGDPQRFRRLIRENPDDPLVAKTDPELVTQANPAVGIRVSMKTLATAARTMDDVVYAREVLCIWDDPQGVPLIDGDTWDALAESESEICGGVVFAVEVSPGLQSGAITVAFIREDGIPFVAVTATPEGRLDHRSGIDWMVPRIMELHERWEPLAWVMDRTGPAGALLDDMVAEGLEPLFVGGGELARACGALLKAALDPAGDKLRHAGQQCLSDAVKATKSRDVGDGAVSFGRKASGDDISTIIAAAEALHGLALLGVRFYDPVASIA